MLPATGGHNLHPQLSAIIPTPQAEQEKEDVLRAMLYVAEDEIRAKEVQVELMQQMLVTTEQEIGAKDGRIGELMAENSKLRDELAKFALLFDRYLSKSEGRPAGGAGLTQRVVPGGTPQGAGAVGASPSTSGRDASPHASPAGAGGSGADAGAVGRQDGADARSPLGAAGARGGVDASGSPAAPVAVDDETVLLQEDD